MDRSSKIPDDLGPHLKAAKAKAKSMGLPNHPVKRRMYLQAMQDELGRGTPSERLSKLSNSTGGGLKKEAFTAGGNYGGGSVKAVWPKRYDPLASPTNRDIPYWADDDAYEDADIVKLARAWCRFYYTTHHIVPTAVDIFARYPLVGMEHDCKDEGISRYYDDLFLGDLEYEEYLTKLGTEYWKVGEAFPMGDWDKNLGVWTDDQLMNPDDIVVEQNLMLKTNYYKFRVPEYMKELVTRPPQEGTHHPEYEAMLTVSPDLLEAIKEDDYIEIDPFNIQHLKHGGNPWSPRGYPILMRAFRQLLLEERLNRAQLAISERMYTPLIMLLLGEKSLGEDGEPWIPTQGDINRTQTLFENIMESEYRTLVHHFGLDIQVPLAGERLPNLDVDYERIERSLLGVFGISPDLLFGGRGGAAYATTAVSAEFLLQRLKTYQSMIRQFLRHRYEAVAAAQGFYDYEMKGKTKVDIYEQVLVVNSDGSKDIKTRKKLLIPDVKFRTIDFRDENGQRDWLTMLKQQGVFISDSKMAKGIDLDPEEERERMIDEQVEKGIANARIRQELTSRAAQEGLTEYVDATFIDPLSQTEKTPPVPPMGAMMYGDPSAMMGGVEPGTDIPEAATGMEPGAEMGGGVPQRPPQSDERKGDAMKMQALRKENEILRKKAAGEEEEDKESKTSYYADNLYGRKDPQNGNDVRRIYSARDWIEEKGEVEDE